MKIRPASAADVSALLHLDRQCPTAAHWSQQQYEDMLRASPRGSPRLVLVAEEDADSDAPRSTPVEAKQDPCSIRAFLVARHIAPDWELENIVVAPATRRKGLATRLFAVLLTCTRETHSESVFLEVRESNQAARALYSRLGFKEGGRRRLYYTNPHEDAVLYRLALLYPPPNRFTRFSQ